MLRFIYVIGLLIKFSFIYLLLKIHIYRKPREKVLKNFFEEAGGAFIKFGQILALRIDVLPKSYSLELMNLLDNMPTFPYQEVKTIFLQELGAVPESIFKDFQKTPFASASFGQVHAAKLSDDTIVAVKVMRPGLISDVGIDFFFIDLLAFLGDIFYKIDALPWNEFAQEFKKWTRNELDYRIEAENAEKMYQSTKDINHIVVPKTFHRYSTQRVLVQEYIEGIPLSRALRGLREGKITNEKLEKLGINIKNAPGILVQELYREYFLEGLFHADPHPGNILLLKNNKIAILDFGIIGKAFKYNMKSFIRWLRAGTEMDAKSGVYHFGDFSAGELIRLVSSVLPANIDESVIDDFKLLISDYFAQTTMQIINKNMEDLENMKKDDTVVFLEIVKASKSLKVKLPEEAVVLLRTTSIIALIGKEIDPEFGLLHEVKKFLNNHTEEELTKNDQKQFLKRINREKAIELFNNWLAYLFEKDQRLYSLVNKFFASYNVTN